MFVWLDNNKLTETDLGLVKMYYFHKQQSPRKACVMSEYFFDVEMECNVRRR